MHLIYKLHLDDGRFYIGVTNNIKRRLKEHKENFNVSSHEVLHMFDDIDEAYAKEREIVNWNLVDDPKCANQTVGGRHPIGRKGNERSDAQRAALATLNGWNAVRLSGDNSPNKCIEHRQRSSEFMKENNPMSNDEVRKKHFDSLVRGSDHPMFGKPGTMLGRQLTKDQKQKISFVVKTPLGVYSSSVEAGVAHGVTQQTIMNRCYSDKPKWADYSVVSKGSKYEDES